MEDRKMGDRKIRNLVRKTSGLTEVRNDEHTWGRFPTLSLPTFFTKYGALISARGCGRQHKAWGGARQRGTPGMARNKAYQARGCGRQLIIVGSNLIALTSALTAACSAG